MDALLILSLIITATVLAAIASYITHTGSLDVKREKLRIYTIVTKGNMGHVGEIVTVVVALSPFIFDGVFLKDLLDTPLLIAAILVAHVYCSYIILHIGVKFDGSYQ